MAYIILSAIILIILLFERTELTFEQNKAIKIRLNFIFFALTLTPSDKKRRKGKRNLISILKAANASVKPLLHGSSVVLVSYTGNSAESVSVPFFKIVSYTAKVNMLLAYLGRSSKTLAHINSGTEAASQYNKIRLCLNFRLYRLFISALFFAYYMLKYRVERKLKNV